MYRITYTTPDIKGQTDTVSGLVVLPQALGGARPLVIYQHGTINDRDSVPSQQSEEAQIPIVYAAVGGIAIAPDYLGFGVSQGFHPYLHAETEASVGIDMIFAMDDFLEGDDIALNDQLFIAGYSQGGHAAAALYRTIQEDYSDVLSVTTAALMSGPYDLSGVTKDRVLDGDPYFFPGFVVNLFLSYNMVYELYDSTSRIFKSPYDQVAEAFFNENLDFRAMNDSLLVLLDQETGGAFPAFMFQDSILQILTDGTPHPINDAIIANDLYNWSPQSPTRLFYCQADDRVPIRNSIVADSVMNENGAPDVSRLDVDPTADHVECVEPAITASLLFFSQFIVTDVPELAGADPLRLYPNPAAEQVRLEGLSGTGWVELFGMNGRLIQRIPVNADQLDIPLPQLSAGIYALRRVGGEKTWSRRLVVER